MKALPPIAEMERAYQASDATYDGVFYLGVRTTGIFCRPRCPARKPLPKNVEYFSTPQSALSSGYRPCKRCRPMENDDQPEWATTLLAEIDRDPAIRVSEGDLSKRGIDPSTVRRYFQKRYGMTFQAYARARRLGGALSSIREGASLDETVFRSGYDSHSGFREAFAKTFGKAPGADRDGDCIFLAWLSSPLGPLIAGATSKGICLLEFTDRRMIEAQFATVQKLFKAPAVPGTNEHLERLKVELDGYFAGTVHDFSVPLEYPGTPFQKQVWDQLLAIPYGETRSYQDLAVAVENPKAVRAVGTTNGLNRIAIVIPCHRVVNKDGRLGGYGGGLRRKQALLDLERTAVAVRR